MMIIIIEYVINAVIVPTSITPWSIFFPQSNNKNWNAVHYKHKCLSIINDMALFVKSITLVRLPLASSNLFFFFLFSTESSDN